MGSPPTRHPVVLSWIVALAIRGWRPRRPERIPTPSPRSAPASPPTSAETTSPPRYGSIPDAS